VLIILLAKGFSDLHLCRWG